MFFFGGDESSDPQFYGDHFINHENPGLPIKQPIEYHPGVFFSKSDHPNRFFFWWPSKALDLQLLCLQEMESLAVRTHQWGWFSLEGKPSCTNRGLVKKLHPKKRGYNLRFLRFSCSTFRWEFSKNPIYS